MFSNEEKQALCTSHHDLLYLIHRYGNGAMLLPQLRTLAVRLGLYPSEQAVGRAVRDLKTAGVLKRMTWLDGRSDLIIGCKYLFRYFAAANNSQEVATAKKYNSPRQYMVQCCKVDYMLYLLDAYPQIETLAEVERFFTKAGATLFLHAPELPDYFCNFAEYKKYDLAEHAAQLTELRRLDTARSRLNAPEVATPTPPPVPVLTLEALHRRNIYVAKVNAQRILLIRYDYSNSLTAARAVDWALDAYSIFHPLLHRDIVFCIRALDALGQADLLSQLATPLHGLPYLESRLSAQHIDGGLSIVVQDSGVLGRWLGGVQVII